MSSTAILSAGFVVVRETPAGPRYLLLRAFQYWDFPKGEVEPGESPLRAAHREVMEETGLTVDRPWGEAYYETPPYHRGKVARYYLGRARHGWVRLGISPQLGRPEHHEYRWVSPEEARRLLTARVLAVLDWAERMRGEGAPLA